MISGLDLVNRRAIERSENYIRRRAILETAQPYYLPTFYRHLLVIDSLQPLWDFIVVVQGFSGHKEPIVSDKKVMVELLEDPDTQAVLKSIVEHKRLRLKDLKEDLQMGSEAISEKLKLLKDAKLIEKEEAPVDDFSTYYVTADGLLAGRQLSQLQQRRMFAF